MPATVQPCVLPPWGRGLYAGIGTGYTIVGEMWAWGQGRKCMMDVCVRPLAVVA